MPTYLDFKNTVYAGINIFSSLTPSVTVPMNDKTKFKVTFRQYSNTHCFYSMGEFFMREDL